MRGIVLAGGVGSRLWPVTLATSKQLLPIFDKPLIYYPLTTLIESGIRDILLISAPVDIERFQTLLGDGSQFGVNLEYRVQPTPDGLAQAFIIGNSFIGNEGCALILGDNLFHGIEFSESLKNMTVQSGAKVFAYEVTNPSDFGIVEFDSEGNAISIEEKPTKAKSSFAIPGLYFYDNDVVEIAKGIMPSARGELEITSINNIYLNRRTLKVQIIQEGTKWLDTGTFHAMLEASNYVFDTERRLGIRIGSPEEAAWRNGWLTDDEFERSAIRFKNSGYGEYFIGLIENR